MNLKSQRRIAASLLKVGANKVKFDKDKSKEIKEALTKEDIRELIKEKIITAKPEKGISSFRFRKLKIQKKKGRKRGEGSREGRRKARLPRKRAWVLKVRTQRKFVKLLRTKGLIPPKIHRNLIRRVKGNFFRSIRHIKLYLEEHKLFQKK